MRRGDPSTTTSGEFETVECPYCGSEDTDREHPKGPALCRSIHFCNECNQPFERFS